MKRFIKFIAAAMTAAMLPLSVSGSGLTLKKFDVSGNKINISGVSTAAGEQVSLVINSGGSAEGIYQSVSGGDGGFAFDIEASDDWSQNYTATISGENSAPQTITFSGDGSYVSYIEPEETVNKKGETTVDAVAYGNKVEILGKLDSTKVTDKNVTLVIYKQGANTNPAKEDIAYIDQTVANEDGEFGFSFNFRDDIRYYKASCYAGGENITQYVKTAKTNAEYITADVTLEVKENNGINLANMYASLKNYGDETTDYILIIGTYDRNGLLVDMIQSDAKSIVSGGTAEESLTISPISDEAQTVKAMLWSVGETLIPLDTAAEQNI